MRVTVTEVSTETFEIDVPDGLDPDSEEFNEECEAARVQYEGERYFVSVDEVSFEPV